MNSHSDDDMFSRYRDELVMDPEARTRTFRKLQERVLRGEQPVPEMNVLPPRVSVSRGFWSSPAKWAATITGLGVGALLVANIALRGAPLVAAVRDDGSQSSAADALGPERVLAPDHLASVEPEAVTPEGMAAVDVAQQQTAATAARSGGSRASTELAKRAANATPAARASESGSAPAVAARPQAIGAPLLAVSRMQKSGSPSIVAAQTQESDAPAAAVARPQETAMPLSAAPRMQGIGPRPDSATRAREAGSQLAVDQASQVVAPEAEPRQASEDVAGLQPSATESSVKAQKLAYASPKEKEATPQRSDQAIASETLTKEVQLLQAAQLALRAGDTQRSLALLAEHTWTYPQGHLAEARDVARILALCQAGNVAQSKLHAKRFLQQRPQSPYAMRVSAGCSAMTDSASTRLAPTP